VRDVAQLDSSLSLRRGYDCNGVSIAVERSVLVRDNEIWPDAMFERCRCENNAALCVGHSLGVFSEIWGCLSPVILVVPIRVVAVLRVDLFETDDVGYL